LALFEFFLTVFAAGFWLFGLDLALFFVVAVVLLFTVVVVCDNSGAAVASRIANRKVVSLFIKFSLGLAVLA
jgi:hypothetical protein